MSPVAPNRFGRIMAVQEDHRALADTLALLRNLKASLANDGDEIISRGAVLVADFAIQLRDHFATEEADTFWGALVLERPSMQSRIDQMRGEHERLTRGVAILEVQVTRGIPGREFAARLGDLIASLEVHERRENLLVQDYLLRDEGVPGD